MYFIIKYIKCPTPSENSAGATVSRWVHNEVNTFYDKEKGLWIVG